MVPVGQGAKDMADEEEDAMAFLREQVGARGKHGEPGDEVAYNALCKHEQAAAGNELDERGCKEAIPRTRKAMWA